MSRPGFSAVIFDLFGTLVPSVSPQKYEALLAEVGQALGTAPEDFIRLWLGEEVVALRTTGAFKSRAEGLKYVCSKLGLEPGPEALQRAVAAGNGFDISLLTPRPDASRTLKTLRERGLRLALMSVCSPHTPQLFRQGPLAALFDDMLFSCEVRLGKPDPRFYELTWQRLGVAPAECLYVGDGACDELTGAQRCGMTAVLICPPGEEAIILAREGVAGWTGPRIAALSEVLDVLDSR
jgi:putative hydrolase of the HAD superfamily